MYFGTTEVDLMVKQIVYKCSLTTQHTVIAGENEKKGNSRDVL